MKFTRLSVGILSLLLLASCGEKQVKQEVYPAYETTVLSKQNAELESVYPASIKGEEDIEIRPRIDGFIDAIYVDEGSVVRKGQTLFKINSPQAIQALTTAQAAVNSAQASVNTAKLNVDRIRPLAEKGIVSQVQLETYQNSYEAANAGLAQANAGLINARETMKWTEVSSPVDGLVGNIPFRKGSLVNSSNVLTNIANTNSVYAYFSLNEKDLMALLADIEGKTQAEKIKNMREVTLILANGTEYTHKGKIGTIAGVINVATGTANFRAKFANKEGLLKSGTSGKVLIPKTLDNVFVIPQQATFALQDKVLVYKVQADSVVQKTVTVQSTPDGKNYAVTDGLAEGERIVSRGLATLSNGKKITVK